MTITKASGVVEPQQVIYVDAREVHAVPVESVISQPVYEPQGGYSSYPSNNYPGAYDNSYTASTDNYFPGPPAVYGPGPQGYVNYGGNQPQMVANNQQQFVQNNGVGICRRCGQHFNRPPNAHSSCAQYYRCDNCARLHIEDICSIC